MLPVPGGNEPLGSTGKEVKMADRQCAGVNGKVTYVNFTTVIIEEHAPCVKVAWVAMDRCLDCERLELMLRQIRANNRRQNASAMR